MERSREVTNATSLRDLVAVVFRYKRVVVWTFLAVLLVGAIVSLSKSPVYEAKSKLLVKVGREYLNRSDMNGTAPMMSVNQGEIINSEIEILRNENSIRKAIETVGLQRIYPDLSHKKRAPAARLAMAAERFQKSLTVEAVKQSNVLEVSFKHSDPAVAAQAVNVLTELYKEKHLQVLAGPRSAFVDSQLTQYRQELQRAEEKLQTYKVRSNISSLVEQRTLLLQQRGSLDEALNKTRADLRELEQKIPSLKANLNNIANSVSRYAPEAEVRIDETRGKLLTMQLEEQQLLKKYTESNPLVVNFRKEMGIVKKYLKEQQRELAHRTNAGTPMYQTIQVDLVKAQADLASLKARESVLQQQLSQVENEVQTLDSKEGTLQQLKREQGVAQKNFETLVGKAEEVRITETMDKNELTNISVIAPASRPSQPVGPTKRENLLRALAIAVAAGLALPFALQFASPRMATPEAVERRLGLRVLAAISYNGEG